MRSLQIMSHRRHCRSLYFSFLSQRQWRQLNYQTDIFSQSRISIIRPDQYIATYKGLAWLIIVGSEFGDWVYWHFTITVNHNTLHIELLLNDVWRTSMKNFSLFEFRSRSHIATDGQSVSLSVESHLGLMIRYILLFDNYGLAFVGRPLWRDDGSVFCMCRWPLPAQSFLVLVPWDRILLSQIWDFPFCRLLRLTGSRWRYSTPPPQG
jgi:hypothetical protein